MALSVNGRVRADGTLRKLARIKRHLVGAPFEAAFEALVNGTARDLPVARLPWRRGESAYIVAGNDPASRDSWDRVTVIFAVDFREETDKAYARVFLQQFQERAERWAARRPLCVLRSAFSVCARDGDADRRRTAVAAKVASMACGRSGPRRAPEPRLAASRAAASTPSPRAAASRRRNASDACL